MPQGRLAIVIDHHIGQWCCGFETCDSCEMFSTGGNLRITQSCCFWKVGIDDWGIIVLYLKSMKVRTIVASWMSQCYTHEYRCSFGPWEFHNHQEVSEMTMQHETLDIHAWGVCSHCTTIAYSLCVQLYSDSADVNRCLVVWPYPIDLEHFENYS